MKGQDILILLKLAVLDSASLVPSAGVREAPTPIYQTIDLPNDQIDRDGPAHPPASVRGLASSLGLSKSEVSKSLKRARIAGLLVPALDSDAERVNRSALCEFLVHGVKYVFPVSPGPVAWGIPTAVDAPVLTGSLMRVAGMGFVWPDPQGPAQGQAIKPLYPSVPFAARQDQLLYDLLALVDSIRLGRARERNVASDLLRQRLGV